MVMAHASLKLDNFAKYKTYMGATILMAVTFLVVKTYEYWDKISHDHLPAESTYLAIYWTMTGLHAIHIIGGIAVNTFLWGPGSEMWRTKRAQFENRVEAAGLYWHFVDLVWIFLFPVLYLL